MGFIRPATPGFLITLTATVLLAVVSFSVPYFKSVYFLKASLSSGGVDGSIIFGVLGYCLELPGNTTCSKPSVGYELDINNLVGNKLPVEIPSVVVKWITYTLVLHIVALGLAAISAAFGLLAHVREMSMACCSTCVSGFAASVALLAFIFDLVLFFVAKSRINAVSGGSAQIGTGIWLTLAAWILLFFSGCFFGIGRCCVRRRPRKDYDDKRDARPLGGLGRPDRDEEMRLDAVKAEADRKALQHRNEVGLPAFHEHEHEHDDDDQSTPLKARVDGDTVYLDDGAAAQPYRDQPTAPQRQFAGGYVPAPVGGRTVDEYNGPSRQSTNPNTYPPQAHPVRQGSGNSQATGFTPSPYPGYSGAAVAAPVAAAAAAPPNQYLAAGAYGGHQQYPTGTSYHTTATHQQQPTAEYGAYYDPYAQSHPQPGPQQGYHAEPTFNPDTYNATGMMVPGASRSPPFAQTPGAVSEYYTPNSEPQSYYGAHPHGAAVAPAAPERSYTLGGGEYYTPDTEPQSYYGAHTQGAAVAHAGPERSYTLGGGYGGNVVPQMHDAAPSPSPGPHGYMPYPGDASAQAAPQHQPSYSPTPIDTSARPSPNLTGGPTRTVTSPTQMGAGHEESPPGYDGPMPTHGAPAWDTKR